MLRTKQYNRENITQPRHIHLCQNIVNRQLLLDNRRIESTHCDKENDPGQNTNQAGKNTGNRCVLWCITMFNGIQNRNDNRKIVEGILETTDCPIPRDRNGCNIVTNLSAEICEYQNQEQNVYTV